MSHMQKLLRIFVLLISALAPYEHARAAAASGDTNWIEPSKLNDMLSEGSGVWVVDVRSGLSYDKGHIEGSVSVPEAALSQRKFPSTKTLVLVDDSIGLKDAKEAAETLLSHGYQKVLILRGGLGAWVAAGYPYTGTGPIVRGITVKELKKVLADAGAIKVYELTGESGKPAIETATAVRGRDRAQRIANLKALLAAKAPASSSVEGPAAIVLVFSSEEDSKENAVRTARDLRRNLFYLIGGSEAYANDNLAQVRIAGACPTCPGGRR